METETSFPHSQVPATCPYSESARSNPYLHIPLPEDPSYYCVPIYDRVFQVVSSLTFPHQNPVRASLPPIRSTCPVHLILLDFITLTIVGEQYRLLSCPHYAVFSSPLWFLLSYAQIFFSTLYSETPSAYVPPLIAATRFHTHKTTFTVVFSLAPWTRGDSILRSDHTRALPLLSLSSKRQSLTLNFIKPPPSTVALLPDRVFFPTAPERAAFLR
jgi:hypothetical protein